jgi:hypothetical protein
MHQNGPGLYRMPTDNEVAFQQGPLWMGYADPNWLPSSESRSKVWTPSASASSSAVSDRLNTKTCSHLPKFWRVTTAANSRVVHSNLRRGYLALSPPLETTSAGFASNTANWSMGHQHFAIVRQKHQSNTGILARMGFRWANKIHPAHLTSGPFIIDTGQTKRVGDPSVPGVVNYTPIPPGQSQLPPVAGCARIEIMGSLLGKSVFERPETRPNTFSTKVDYSWQKNLSASAFGNSEGSAARLPHLSHPDSRLPL